MKKSLLTVLLCLPALAAHAVSPESATSDAAASKAQNAAAQPSALTPQTLFLILAGEMALAQGQVGVATESYKEAALFSRSPEVVERAAQLAAAARRADLALALTKLWRDLQPASTDAFDMEAELLYQAGRFPELTVFLGKGLKTAPRAAQQNIFELVARLADSGVDPARRGDFRAMADALGELAPQLPEAHYLQALGALAMEDRAAARAQIQQARQLGFADQENLILLDARLIAQEKGDAGAKEIIAQLSAFLKTHPKADKARLALARAYLSQNDVKPARAQFSRLARDNPDRPDILYPAALLALEENDPASARDLLTRLLALPFDKGTTLFFLGQTEEADKKPADALTWYQRVPSGSGHFWQAREAAVRVMLQTPAPDRAAQIKAALDYVEKTPAETPADRLLRDRLKARLQVEGGDFDGAYQTLSAAAKEAPDEPNLVYDLALAADRIGRFEEMESLLRKLIAAQPDNANALNALGYSLADRNQRLPEALGLIGKALELDPGSPYIQDSMGWALYRLGRMDAALAALEKAWKILPDPEIAAHLGEVLWQSGRQSEAIQLWNEAAKAAPENDTLQATRKRFLP
ncbi:MAG: tetratricopeptide repeat protein [Zoogloeaceae bacterium]|nr:tetratricopeptide repeat protein [Zoogloeaceae bacterium]